MVRLPRMKEHHPDIVDAMSPMTVAIRTDGDHLVSLDIDKMR